MARKSYNPFKMWGSYVGAVSFLVFNYFYLKGVSDVAGGIPANWFYNLFLSNGGDQVGMVIGTLLFSSLVTLILGFLIGWGIHSLVRKLK